MAETSIPGLRKEWERLQIKHGIAGSPPGLERLLLTTRRKQARLRDLRMRLSVIQDEVDALEDEVAGLEKALRCLLNEVISRTNIEAGHLWSPVAMLGFRVWTFADGGFHGYRQRWEHRSLTAACGSTDNQEDVPHTDGECGKPPCGVYAAKDVGRLLAAHRDIDAARLAIGLVALTGKVVEHEKGWRAEEATVLAITFVRGGAVHSTNQPEEIELLFQGVGVSGQWNGPISAGRPDPIPTMAGYMREQEREAMRWISESPNEL